jgi:hypothetical protein
MTAFWDTALRNLVEVDGRFGGTYRLQRQGEYLMMKAVHTSKTSVFLNETTRRYIPESCYLIILVSASKQLPSRIILQFQI